jgi:hypothetical protein
MLRDLRLQARPRWLSKAMRQPVIAVLLPHVLGFAIFRMFHALLYINFSALC